MNYLGRRGSKSETEKIYESSGLRTVSSIHLMCCKCNKVNQGKLNDSLPAPPQIFEVLFHMFFSGLNIDSKEAVDCFVLSSGFKAIYIAFSHMFCDRDYRNVLYNM